MSLANLIIIYFILLLSIAFISKKMKFYDKPNNRKIHNSKVFNTGGIIIYLFYLLIINYFEIISNSKNSLQRGIKG